MDLDLPQEKEKEGRKLINWGPRKNRQGSGEEIKNG